MYQWSAPIDLLEQYEFLAIRSHDLTLQEIFIDYYSTPSVPTGLTCYIHLECNRGSKSICLDWTEICDGIVHCINDQIEGVEGESVYKFFFS